jgi:chromosome segregation ATPase
MWRVMMYMCLVGACVGCSGVERNEQLQMRVDSLKAELLENQNAMQTLQEIGVLMDSIDADRFVLRTQMIEGTSQEDYSARMLSISSYVHEAEQRVGMLEDRVKSLKDSNSSYKIAIKKVKALLEKTNLELVAMQETVTNYRNKNDNLIQTVTLQEQSLGDKLNQISMKESEIDQLEQNVEDLLEKSRINEAESYYMRAVAVEEAARRTHFAPRRKKDTTREALELYRMAAFYGKEEAEHKIRELEKEI